MRPSKWVFFQLVTLHTGVHLAHPRRARAGAHRGVEEAAPVVGSLGALRRVVLRRAAVG